MTVQRNTLIYVSVPSLMHFLCAPRVLSLGLETYVTTTLDTGEIWGLGGIEQIKRSPPEVGVLFIKRLPIAIKNAQVV